MRIDELRSNPSINIHDKTSKVWDILNEYTMDNRYYISMTDLPKIGINPLSQFTTTPIGIYAYPINFLSRFSSLEELPYAGDARYVNLIKSNNQNRLRYDTNPEEYRSKFSKIMLNYGSFESDIFLSPKVKTGDDLYDATRRLSVWISYLEENNSIDESFNLEKQSSDRDLTLRVSRIWSGILRKLGFDMIVDDGFGFIHRNEPTQTIFLNTNPIESTELFDTKRSSYIWNTKHTMMKAFNNKKINPSELANFIHFYITTNNYYSVKNARVYRWDKFIDGRKVSYIIDFTHWKLSNTDIIALLPEISYTNKYPDIKRWIELN